RQGPPEAKEKLGSVRANVAMLRETGSLVREKSEPPAPKLGNDEDHNIKQVLKLYKVFVGIEKKIYL
ncbi:MAG: hypothetical protein KAW12_09650, partial [Candidatus Aminicenantes bacterium]|nr:hypothetical protein [Candidatus Aminicenantes bacterium]